MTFTPGDRPFYVARKHRLYGGWVVWRRCECQMSKCPGYTPLIAFEFPTWQEAYTYLTLYIGTTGILN